MHNLYFYNIEWLVIPLVIIIQLLWYLIMIIISEKVVKILINASQTRERLIKDLLIRVVNAQQNILFEYLE